MSILLTQRELLAEDGCDLFTDEIFPDGFNDDSSGQSHNQHLSGGSFCTQDDWPAEPSEPPKPSTPEEARGFLVTFFANRDYYLGGPIPRSVLLEDQNVEIVLRLDLGVCIDLYHQALEESGFVKLRDNWEQFFKLQNESARLGIPKHHSGGLLLVWLRLCKGLDI